MASVMSIVSKALFEKAAGKAPRLGQQLAMDRYVSANKAFEPLAAGGTLYLVTVRPPNEALWLVAVLDNPKFDGKQWVAKPCATPLTDITSLRAKIKFESGKGITAAAGALGMSLQTPRTLTADDAALIDNCLAPAAPAPAAGPAMPPPPSVASGSAGMPAWCACSTTRWTRSRPIPSASRGGSAPIEITLPRRRSPGWNAAPPGC